MNAWLLVEQAVLTAKHMESPHDKELMRASRLLNRVKSADVARAKEIEKTTRHDLVAFVRAVCEQMEEPAESKGKNPGRFVHQGITSYDIEDTAQSLLLAKAGHMVAERLYKLSWLLHQKANVFKYAPCNGYTHNQIAEPVTIGKRFLDIEIAIREQAGRFEAEMKKINLCKIKGAVGIYGGSLTPEFEGRVASILGMRPAPTATQILPIENLVSFFNPLVVVACHIENFAQNLRLASGDLAEAKEGFAKGQTGSSTMTFKENPINIENITGAARKMKSLMNELIHATGTWRERDISNSFQVQRHIIPEMFETAEHIASKTIGVLENLRIFPIQSLRNIMKYGDLAFAGAAKEWLAGKECSAGRGNEEIYGLIQKESIAAKHAADFRGETPDLFGRLDYAGTPYEKELKMVMSLPYNLRNVAKYYELATGGKTLCGEEDIHARLADYIIDGGHLAMFGKEDSAAFIRTYGTIVEKNYESDNNLYSDAKKSLRDAVARLTKELEK
jgi:adenylosuccinate lyase